MLVWTLQLDSIWKTGCEDLAKMKRRERCLGKWKLANARPAGWCTEGMDPQIKALYVGNRRCGPWPGSADKRAFPLHLCQCIIDENGAYGGWARPGQPFRIHSAGLYEWTETCSKWGSDFRTLCVRPCSVFTPRLSLRFHYCEHLRIMCVGGLPQKLQEVCHNKQHKADRSATSCKSKVLWGILKNTCVAFGLK